MIFVFQGVQMAERESFDEWMLKDRLKAEVLQLYDVWRIYISWYTVFLTLNVIALTFYHSVAGPSQSKTQQIAIPLFFVIQNLCAVLTSISIKSFSTRAVENYNAALDALHTVMIGQSQSLAPAHVPPLLPKPLLVRSAWFNVSGPGTLAII